MFILCASLLTPGVFVGLFFLFVFAMLDQTYMLALHVLGKHFYH
jgi:hypothetical protein